MLARQCCTGAVSHLRIRLKGTNLVPCATTSDTTISLLHSTETSSRKLPRRTHSGTQRRPAKWNVYTPSAFGAVLPCSWAPLDPGWTEKSTKQTKLKVVFTFCTLPDTLNAAENFYLIPSTDEMLHFEPYVELRDFHAAGIPHREVPN